MWLQNLLPCAADQPNLEQYCNVRIPIPGWGGNWLEFRQEGGGKPPLMFPILNELGLSMYHASEWAHSLIRLEFCDITLPYGADLGVMCMHTAGNSIFLLKATVVAEGTKTLWKTWSDMGPVTARSGL